MQNHRIAALFAGLIFLSAAAYGQSLGDVARQQRQKQAAKTSASPHKVVTDEDMPSHPDVQDSADKNPSSKATSGDTSGSPINSASNAEEVKARFLEQKQKIKDFEGQLNELRASIKYVEANRYSNGVQYNQSQQRNSRSGPHAETTG